MVKSRLRVIPNDACQKTAAHMERSVHGAQTDLKSVAGRKAEGPIPLRSV